MSTFADGTQMDNAEKPHGAQPEDKVPLAPSPGVPVPDTFAQQPLTPWSTELWECFHDMPSCVENTLPIWWFQSSRQYNILSNDKEGIEPMSCLVSFGADVLIGGNLGSFILAWHLRRRIRGRYNIQGSDVADCLVSYFCLPCVVCQNYREMSVRGEWPGGFCASSPFQKPVRPDASTIN